MWTFHAAHSRDRIRERLRARLAADPSFSGSVGVGSFRVVVASDSQQAEVVLRGFLIPDDGGTRVLVSPEPTWGLLLSLPIWALAALFMEASPWFIVLGISVSVGTFVWHARSTVRAFRTICLREESDPQSLESFH